MLIWRAWGSGAPTVEDALKKQIDLLGDLKKAYGDLKTSVKDYESDTVAVSRFLNEQAARESEKSIQKAVEATRIPMRQLTNPAYVPREFRDEAAAISALYGELQKSNSPDKLAELRKELTALAQQADTSIVSKNVIQGILEATESAAKL